MAPVHTFPFYPTPINKYSNLINHNISTVPFTRYLFTYPDINVARRSFGIVGFAARSSWIHSPLDIGTSSTSTVDDEIPHSLQMMLCVLQRI
jgi:hypothetical protein